MHPGTPAPGFRTDTWGSTLLDSVEAPRNWMFEDQKCVKCPVSENGPKTMKKGKDKGTRTPFDSGF